MVITALCGERRLMIELCRALPKACGAGFRKCPIAKEVRIWMEYSRFCRKRKW